MEFWAIGYLYQEDVFFDLKDNEDTMDMTSKCLLPTKEMAEQFIEDQLSIDYTPIKIELETLNKNGVWSWARDTVPQWDE